MSSVSPEQNSMTDTFELEVAQKVILPKLQQVYQQNPDISSKAEFRKEFNALHGVSLSAAKFEEYLSYLNINFTKKVVIEGLFPGVPPRPQAGAATPEELEDDDFAFDNESPPTHRGNMNPRDMFGLA